MQVAAIIATALIVAGFLLWLLDRRTLRKAAEAERSAASEGSASAGRSGSAAALGEAASPERSASAAALREAASPERGRSAAALGEAASSERSGSAAGAEKSASAASPAKAAPERSASAASAKEKEEPGWSSSQAAGAGAAGVVSSGAEPEGEACCGQHYSCEKDSLLTAVASGIDYYEDEELDRYAGRKPDDYSEAEKDEFRDVMLTLLPSDLAGWGRSIQLRGINLPAEVRDEFLLLIDELRAAKTKTTE